MSDDKKSKTPKDTHYANLRRAFRDQKAGGGKTDGGKFGGSKPGGAPAFRPRPPVAPGEAPPEGLVRLYGIHTVRAALDNPSRKISRLAVTRNAAERLGLPDLSTLPFAAELVEPRDIDRITGSEAVHQGVVIEARPLTPKPLDALGDTKLLVVLDQVTDPHNVGAILRSAAAFGAAALVTQDRHAPPEGGALAKAASGALEIVPWVRVVNLARALEDMAEAGYWRIGLAGEAEAVFADAVPAGPVALVLGAEGEGLRHNIAAHCDALARLPMSGAIESLNVSNAAAIALYAIATR